MTEIQEGQKEMKHFIPVCGLAMLTANCGTSHENRVIADENSERLTETSELKLGIWFDENRIPEEISAKISSALGIDVNSFESKEELIAAINFKQRSSSDIDDKELMNKISSNISTFEPASLSMIDINSAVMLVAN